MTHSTLVKRTCLIPSYMSSMLPRQLLVSDNIKGSFVEVIITLYNLNFKMLNIDCKLP